MESSKAYLVQSGLVIYRMISHLFTLVLLHPPTQGATIDYLLKTRRIRLSNVSRLLKSARSGEEK